jgi:NACalpha-BTF3-like transcription factor
VTDEDIELVSSKTGISDRDRVREALEHNNGDIAATILELTGSAE